MNKYRQPSLCDFMSNLKSEPHKTFQIIEKIGIFPLLSSYNPLKGEGTYAKVYKAIDKITDKLVAIKIFPAHNDQFAYLNEIDFLRKLDHPYMVQLYDVYATPDEIWMILEYCQLGSIQDLVHNTETTLSEPEIACVCYSVLQALDYIHTLNKIHRDVKSANILINSFGQVKLTDFGICSTESVSNSFIGSLLWMAPEILSGGVYDSSVDIWALGICLIEMAEGNAPYHHLHMVRAKFAIQKKPQTQFQEPQKYSHEIRDFLDLCLQIEPKNRPTASELLGHPFIEKYKGRMYEIRKQICNDRIKKLEEYRKNIITSSRKTVLDELEETPDLPDLQTNVENPSDMRQVNISAINHIDVTQENLTFIEKSTLEIMNEDNSSSQISYPLESQRSVFEPKANPGSHLHFAIEQLKLENQANQQVKQGPQYNFHLNDILESTNTAIPKKPAILVNHLQIPSNQPTTNQLKASLLSYQTHGHDYDHSILSERSHEELPRTDIYSSVNTKCLDESPALRNNLAATAASNLKSTKGGPKASKQYKVTNESNFVVKHQGASRTTMYTYMNQSIDDEESSLNPMSFDKRLEEDELEEEAVDNNLVKNAMMGTQDFSKTRTASSLKDCLMSTAVQSKVGSFFYKSPTHTPNPSGKHKMAMSNIIRKDIEEVYTEETVRNERLEEERQRIEEQMKKEMEEVQRKYNAMLKNLGK